MRPRLAEMAMAGLLALPLVALPEAPHGGTMSAEAQGAPKNPRGRRQAPPRKAEPASRPAETTPAAKQVEPAPAAPASGLAPMLPAQAAAGTPAPPEAAEKVEADVSMRTVPIKLGYKGSEIIVFGSVMNSRQPSAESGFYEMIVVLEGSGTPLVLRRKRNIGGVWVNTSPFVFERAPSYYAVISTSPIEEIAEGKVLSDQAIGFDYMRIRAREGPIRSFSSEEFATYREALVRLKRNDGLYVEKPHGVAFTGQSLFRATVELPANITVGPVEVNVYLFLDGKLLSQHTRHFTLERAGLEEWLYWFANTQPLFYGLFTVAFAMGAGLFASAVFKRSGH